MCAARIWSATLAYLIASLNKLVHSIQRSTSNCSPNLSEFWVGATGIRARRQTSFMDRSKVPSWIEVCLALINIYVERMQLCVRIKFKPWRQRCGLEPQAQSENATRPRQPCNCATTVIIIFSVVTNQSRIFGAACGLLSEAVRRQPGKSFARRKLKASRFTADFDSAFGARPRFREFGARAASDN